MQRKREEWSRARRRRNLQRRLMPSMQRSPWKGIAGGLLAGAAGLLAYFAIQSAAEKKTAGEPNFSFSPDPMSAPRFDRKRAFGWF